jgi:hypothetical protein
MHQVYLPALTTHTPFTPLPRAAHPLTATSCQSSSRELPFKQANTALGGVRLQSMQPTAPERRALPKVHALFLLHSSSSDRQIRNAFVRQPIARKLFLLYTEKALFKLRTENAQLTLRMDQTALMVAKDRTEFTARTAKITLMPSIEKHAFLARKDSCDRRFSHGRAQPSRFDVSMAALILASKKKSSSATQYSHSQVVSANMRERPSARRTLEHEDPVDAGSGHFPGWSRGSSTLRVDERASGTLTLAPIRK